MRIQKLIIYGFGQHEDITIEMKDGINVFFGWNEAGKTTIQQFVLSVLFGFPLRNQGILRYEPKGGGRHGGQVHINHQEFGNVVIERVKGKSAGDVTVFFEDGNRGGEESLKQVLYRYDRSSFESIFSFSIHQLQDFDKMSEEELSRTLLASGTTGVDTITKLEQRATKEMNALFKKSGKNPEMNQKIEEIRVLDQALKEDRAKIDQFEPSISRLSEIDRLLADLKKEEQFLKHQHDQLLKYRQAKPLLEKQLQLETELSSIQQLSFPAEGIRRYETLKDSVQELQVKMEQLQLGIQNLGHQAKQSVSFERIQELEDLLAKESEWHHWQIRKQQLTNEIEQANREMEQHARLLGMQDEQHFKHVKEMDVSLQREEDFQQVMQRFQQAEEAVRFESHSRERIQRESEEVELRIQQLQSSAPNEDEQKQSGKLQQLMLQLAELRARKDRTSARSNIPLIVSSLILLATIIGAIFFGESGLAVGGVFLAGLVFVLLNKMNPAEPKSFNNDDSIKISKIEQELLKTQQLADQLRLYNDRMIRLVDQRQERQQMLKKSEQNISDANIKRAEEKNTLDKFLNSYGFDGLLHSQLFPELFKRIRQIQEQYQLILRNSKERQAVMKQIEERLVRATQLSGEFLSEQGAYSRLREVIYTLKGAQKDQREAQEKIKENISYLNEKEKLFILQSDDIQTLWRQAQVKTESAFYEADVAFRKKKSLQQDLRMIHDQLYSIGEITFEYIDDQQQVLDLEQLEETSNHISKNRNELLEEKALLKQQTSSMVSDDHYGHTLQIFEQKKSELAELAHKWSVNKAVSEAIKQTMHNLKEKRLPFVLKKAQEFFSHLTNKRYDSLEVNEQGIFEVIDHQGIHFRISELSQATKEQAYISLRFALAESLLDTIPFPIIMDDPFVHFDRFRVKQMVQLMTDLKYNHQFLYFTCHEEMTKIWPDAHVIDITTLQKKRSVPSI
ncbi:AAA family ATPase [Paenisporosarcina sp. TG20]|uniref:ATP-binding protein n=1 Tax=Paenisporosarcina sp. TG20 TaxID=1211706 RepID=UPI0002FF8949|nr:AAA family ATPase [Paenisporosarcina sp. TG20]